PRSRATSLRCLHDALPIATLALANIYYDFPISGVGAAGGGFGAYVGAGLGVAYNHVSSDGPNPGPEGKTWSAAGAVMTGVMYDRSEEHTSALQSREKLVSR